jgi:hypothetical protein
LIIIQIKLTLIMISWFQIQFRKWILDFRRLQTRINRIIFINALLIINVIWKLRLWLVIFILYSYFFWNLWKRDIFIFWCNSFFLLTISYFLIWFIKCKSACIIFQNLLLFDKIFNLLYKRSIAAERLLHFLFLYFLFW